MPDPILTSFDKAKILKRKSLEEQGIITKVPTDIIFADEVVDDNIEENEKEINKDLVYDKNSPKDKRRLQLLKESCSKSDGTYKKYIACLKTYLNQNERYRNMGSLSYDDIKKSANDIYNVLSDCNWDITYDLVNEKPDGQGKGEYFLEFIYDDASSLGGGQSYDIKCNNGKIYEVKCYPRPTSPIRLGKEGYATRFKEYNNFLFMLTAINKLVTLDSNKMTILSSMIENAKTKMLKIGKDKSSDIDNIDNFLSEIFTSRSKKGNKYNYYAMITGGTFDNKDMKDFVTVISIAKLICDEVFKNNFEFAKLVKENKLYVTKLDENGKPTVKEEDGSFFIECVSDDVKSEDDVKEVIMNIRDTINSCFREMKVSYDDDNAPEKYMNNLIYILEEHINKDFEGHPMILVNDLKTTANKNLDIIVYGVYTKFYVCGIQQNGINIQCERGSDEDEE